MLLALFVAAQAAAPAAPTAGHELRGLWIVRTGLVSPEAVDRVVDDAAGGGLNALFVQVRGRGDAFYDSHLVARSPLLERQPAGFDPLARLIERARARGLEVHAWINVLLAAHFSFLPEDNVVARHPGWLMVPKAAARTSLPSEPRGLLWLIREKSRGDGDVEGYYLSPSSPEAGAHLEDVVRELVRGYAVQGLHFDFIRYPGPDYDYSLAALDAFRRQQGGASLLEGPVERPAAWEAYRRETLTALATRLSRAAREERAGLVVSAAVVPDRATALSQKFQDWPGWLASGVLDAVCPMAYTPDSRIFREQIAEAGARTSREQAVWAGIGAYRLSLAGVAERIVEARAAGASGYVLFSHESLDGAALRLLRAQTPAPPPAGARGSVGAPASLPR
jgi:uncharacterized lipoprotein YddW (UPF0748 family)